MGLGQIEFMAIMSMFTMAADTFTPREDAILRALGSVSKVLGKDSEYQNFVSYVNAAGKDKMPSVEDIATHTPSWVQLVMPILGKLYDTGYRDGEKDENDAWLRAYKTRG